MSAELQKINPRHFKILDLALRGLTPGQIAEAVNLCVDRVSVILKSPSFQHEMALRRAVIDEKRAEAIAEGREDPVLAKLRSGALQAAQKLVMNISDPSPNVAHRASVEILDRTGYVPTQKHEVSGRHLVVNIDSDASKNIQETLSILRGASA